MSGEDAADPFLFVYGTLRPAVRCAMSAWLAANAEHVGSARTRGRLYDLGEYPGLVPAQAGLASAEDRRAGAVAGDLYRLSEPDEMLARLDEYEGCGERNPYGAFRRERISVLAGRVEFSAWAYVHRGSVDPSRAILSGDYAAWLDERGRSRPGRIPPDEGRPLTT